VTTQSDPLGNSTEKSGRTQTRAHRIEPNRRREERVKKDRKHGQRKGAEQTTHS
jgi:hypothetical protein